MREKNTDKNSDNLKDSNKSKSVSPVLAVFVNFAFRVLMWQPQESTV